MWTRQSNGKDGKNALHLINSLSIGIGQMVLKGYTETFKITSRGLYAITKGRFYRPEQVLRVETFRYDRTSGLEGPSIMFSIETSDNVRGTLIELQEGFRDDGLQAFIREVERIRNKMDRHDHLC